MDLRKWRQEMLYNTIGVNISPKKRRVLMGNKRQANNNLVAAENNNYEYYSYP